MSGYVTETKKTDASKRVLFGNFGQEDLSALPVIPDRKTTYSFRSGSRAPSEGDSLIQDSNIWTPAASYTPFDNGHEFWTHSQKLEHYPREGFNFWKSGYHYRLVGPVIITGRYSSAASMLPVSTRMDANDVALFGSRAINATAPTRSNGSLSQFLAELQRDGIPALVGATLLRSRSSHSLSEEWLNLNFGWAPIISDIRKILTSVRNSSKLVQQMRRDSGRIVRRRFSFPAEQTETSESYDAPYADAIAGLTYLWYSSAGDGRKLITVTDRVNRKVWFSGAYTYYLDMGDSLVSKFARYEQLANQLLGTRLNASLLYELAPWSWLADWFTDLGTVINNASKLTEDGLVIHHGYLMSHTVTRRTVEAALRLGDERVPRTFTNLYSSEMKERVKATPYGFGVNMSGLTAWQWSILGALGMTRSPRVAF